MRGLHGRKWVIVCLLAHIEGVFDMLNKKFILFLYCLNAYGNEMLK